MCSQRTREVRDVSGIAARPGLTWSSTEFDECPYCHRLTPAPYIEVAGTSARFAPYPCDCPGARRARAEFDAAQDRIRESRASRVPRTTAPPRFSGSADQDAASAHAAAVAAGRGLYLHGLPGRGKTATAWAVAGILGGRGWTVEVAKMPSVMASLDDSFETGVPRTETLGRLARCDLLVLDDLGNENVTERSVSVVLDILDRRCEAMRPVVVTSNYSRDQLAARYARANKVAALSIASRLVQMTDAAEVRGPDRRAL